jgi:hypothetical protein
MSSKFIKKIESFVCELCGKNVEGSGYTNHCPECLWSKHVDIFPGDRKGDCGGMMEPIGVEVKNKEYTILHRCKKCREEKKNKAVKEDSFDMLVQISAQSGKV